MTRHYKYQVQVRDGNNSKVTLDGVVECEFVNVFDRVISETFGILTHGEALYGHPGHGCVGPYKVIRVLITSVGSQ
jgi:hypothetical protein